MVKFALLWEKESQFRNDFVIARHFSSAEQEAGANVFLLFFAYRIPARCLECSNGELTGRKKFSEKTGTTKKRRAVNHGKLLCCLGYAIALHSFIDFVIFFLEF